MGRTFRHDTDYHCKNDHRDRNDRKLKKLNKRLQKITNQKLLYKSNPPQEGVEFV